MDQILINSILATIVISVLSLVGVVTFFIKNKTVNKITLYLVAFSTGALIGGAFLHLLPEAIESSDSFMPVIYLRSRSSVFFIRGRLLKWQHCHKESD